MNVLIISKNPINDQQEILLKEGQRIEDQKRTQYKEYPEIKEKEKVDLEGFNPNIKINK